MNYYELTIVLQNSVIFPRGLIESISDLISIGYDGEDYIIDASKYKIVTKFWTVLSKQEVSDFFNTRLCQSDINLISSIKLSELA